MSPAGVVFVSASNAQAGGTGETFPVEGNVAPDAGDVRFFDSSAEVAGTDRLPNSVEQLGHLLDRGLTPGAHDPCLEGLHLIQAAGVKSSLFMRFASAGQSRTAIHEDSWRFGRHTDRQATDIAFLEICVVIAHLSW